MLKICLNVGRIYANKALKNFHPIKNHLRGVYVKQWPNIKTGFINNIRVKADLRTKSKTQGRTKLDCSGY